MTKESHSTPQCVRTLSLFHSRMAWVGLLFCASLGTAIVARAGEDKGTIGIVCRDAGGNRFEVTSDLKGEQREKAIRAFQACTRSVLEKFSQSEMGTSLLFLEKTMDGRDGGVDSVVVEGYNIYRNTIDQLQAEQRKKSGQKDSKKQSPSGQTGPDSKKRK